MRPILISAFAAAVLGVAGHAYAADEHEQVIVIQNNRFDPAEVTVPADTPIRLIVDNRDATPEEFESDELRLEKIIPGHSQATLRVGPLAAGQYGFFGEFHEDTALGVLIAE